MKKLILLSILLIVGCSKTSTSAPSCTELTKAYVDASSAYSADPTNNDLCNSYVAALQKLVDAGCSGYTQAAVNLLQNTCNNSLEAVYGCTDPNAVNYDEDATTPCNNGTDNDCCEEGIVGCVDVGANNYNPLANISCSDCCEY